MNDAKAKLNQLINRAPQEIQPQKELWSSIEKQLDKPELQQLNPAQPKATPWRHLAIASLVLLCSVVGMNLWQQSPQLTPTSPLLITLAEIKQQHQLQVEQLSQHQLTDWQVSEMGLPLEKGIEQLRQAAELIYQALRQTPNDKELWQLWLWTQQREIELLQQGQKLPVNPLPQGAKI